MSRELMTRIDRVSDQVASARSQIAAGDVRDLSPIQAAVEEICSAVRRLPRDQRAQYEKRMVALLDDIDRLTTSIRVELGRLGQETQAANQHRRAATAYGRATPPRRL